MDTGNAILEERIRGLTHLVNELATLMMAMNVQAIHGLPEDRVQRNLDISGGIRHISATLEKWLKRMDEESGIVG